jgi:hypothetical protein
MQIVDNTTRPSWRRLKCQLRKLWWGQYSLSQAFWGFYVVGFILVVILALILMIITRTLHISTVGFIFGFAIVNCYWLAAAVGVWRSARVPMASTNRVCRFWAIAARGVVLFSAARMVLHFGNGGELWLMSRMTAGINF